MADISQTIDVSIDIKSKSIIGENFGLLLILGTHKVFNDRYRAYSNASDMLLDGFTTTSKEYIAATKVFGQAISPPEVYVGRRNVDAIKMQVITAIDNTDYYIKINNTIFLINSGVAATAITIATAIVAAVNGGSEPVVAVDNLDGTYAVNANVSGVPYTLAYDNNQSCISMLPTDDIVNDIIAINQENSTWYALIETLRDKDELLELAAWCETAYKLLGTLSNNSDIVDENTSIDTDSIAVLMKALSYKHTFVMYSANADQFSDAAIFGEELPHANGDSKFELKTLAGITSDNLTVNQHNNAMNKYVTTYEPCAGSSYTYGGRTSSGIFIDIIRDADYLMQQMQIALFALLTENNKVPFDQSGLVAVESEMRKVLTSAVNSKIITNDFTITMPAMVDIPEQDKVNRTLKGVKFSAVLTNSIDYVQINGTLNY